MPRTPKRRPGPNIARPCRSGIPWLVLLAERALLHPRAIEWFAFAAGRGAAAAFVADEESRIRNGGVARRLSPVFQQVVDYDTLLELNTFGETMAVERRAYVEAAGDFSVSSVSAARTALLNSLARDGRVGHIPCPLVCRDGEITVDPAAAIGAQAEALRAHLTAKQLENQIAIRWPGGPLPRLILWRPREPDAVITVIVATRDNGSDVARSGRQLETNSRSPAEVFISLLSIMAASKPKRLLS